MDENKIDEVLKTLSEEQKEAVLKSVTCLLFGHDYGEFVCRRCGSPRP